MRPELRVVGSDAEVAGEARGGERGAEEGAEQQGEREADDIEGSDAKNYEEESAHCIPISMDGVAEER